MRLNSIPFNKASISNREEKYVLDVLRSGSLAGGGLYSLKSENLFSEMFNFKKSLLTHSCTAALEMAAILIGVEDGDEVIVPSYTFVSTASSFALRGAKIVFSDINPSSLNITAELIEPLITPKTKVIVVVHYAGVICDMGPILDLARKHGIFVVEDAAQAIGSKCNKGFAGSFGDFAAFSFHETKNLSCGHGGMLVVNNDKFIERAEVIQAKGTNRRKFNRGEVDFYTWTDLGSSFFPSEINAAYLFAQLERFEEIQNERKKIYDFYIEGLSKASFSDEFQLPFIGEGNSSNYHLFYLLVRDSKQRNDLIEHMKLNGINAPFHYIPLHSSDYGRKFINPDQDFSVTNNIASRIIRLPLYFGLTRQAQVYILEKLINFYEK